MKMSRWLTATVCLLTAVASIPAYGQTLGDNAPKRAPKNVLTAIPGDAWAVLCIPNSGGLEQKINAFAQQLQLPPASPLAMGKMIAGIMTGYDDDGGLALALMPMQTFNEVDKSLVMFIPTTDYDALMTAFAPEAMDGGMSRMLFMDKETYAAPFGKFAAVSQNPEALSRVLGATTTFADRLGNERVERLQQDDLTLWINLNGFTTSEMFNGMAPMLAMGGIDPDMVRQLKSMAISLRFDPAGLNIGLYGDAEPGSDYGKAISAVKATDKSLLVGLPKDEFIVAAGSTTSEAAGTKGAEMLDGFVARAAAQAGEHRALVESLGKIGAELIRNMRHTSLSLSPLAGGKGGMVGVAVVVNTDGASGIVRESIKKSLDTVKASLGADPNAAQVLEMISFSTAAEKIDGIDVDHFKVSPPFDPDSEEAEKAEIVLGTDGVLLRIAAVDKNNVVVALGGGTERFSEIVAAVKSGQAPLGADESVQSVAANVPKQRYQEIYIHLDRALKLVQRIGKAVGDDPQLGDIPDVGAPLAIVSAPAGVAGAQTEIFLPMKLIRTIKDVAMMQAMGGGRQQQQFQPADPPPAS